MRHWKQHFDSGSDFVWTRPVLYDGVQYKRGDRVEGSALKKAKQFWDIGWIELANWDIDPSGLVSVLVAPPKPKAKKKKAKKRKKKKKKA